MGKHFSIENPRFSLLWEFGPVKSLSSLHGVFTVDFDQCAYGLALPGALPNHFCKKATRILTNLSALQGLQRFCPGPGAQ